MREKQFLIRRCYMDGIDWEHQLECEAEGTLLFPSVKSLKEVKDCIDIGGCGVVEVEVRLLRWVEPQNLKYATVEDTIELQPCEPKRKQ